MEDITAPKVVEVEIRHDGKVVWIHVEGITVLRACRVGELTITDHREDHEEEASQEDA